MKKIILALTLLLLSPSARSIYSGDPVILPPPSSPPDCTSGLGPTDYSSSILPQQALPTLMGGGTPITIPQWNANFTTLAKVANEANLKVVSVIDFGAVQNCVVSISSTCDSSIAFQAAIDATSICGGVIQIPGGPWIIDTPLSYSNKNIKFDIDPTATFTGAGNFPRSLVLPLIQPISNLTNYAPVLTPVLNGGYVGSMYEFTQGPGQTGWDSTVFISGILDSSVNTPLYGGVNAVHINSVATTGSTGRLYGLTIGHKVNSVLLTDDAAVNIITTGTYNSSVGIKLRATGTGKFTNGIKAASSDLATNGKFLNLTDSTGLVNLFNVDANGAIHVKGSAVSDSTGTLVLGNATSTSASTTSSGAIVPALAAKYLIIYIGTIPYKIPLYAQ